MQALDDDALRFLGREHDAAEARQAVALAQRIMPRSSFDLIYARPGQTVDAWRAELTEALSFAGDHLSLYQLTIEKGTPFWRQERDGAFALPDDDTGRALYDLTQEAMEAAGFAAYEVSNHARGGDACRHNLAYWRYDDYVGIGPGAHGRVRGRRATSGWRPASTPAPNPGSPPSSATATARPKRAPSTPTSRRARC